MAKYIVTQDFTDKETGVIYIVGEKYPAEIVTKDRLIELLGDDHEFHVGGLVSKIDENADEKPTNKNTVVEISSYLDEKGINHEGITKKAELLELL